LISSAVTLEQDLFEAQRSEEISFSLEEFVLKFNPMQSQSMEECFHQIHAHENAECSCKENIKEGEELYLKYNIR
jgi:Cu/Zn superoxide dismutase